MWKSALLLTAPIFALYSSGSVVLTSEVFDAADTVQLEIKLRSGNYPSLVSVCVLEESSVPEYCLNFRDHKPVRISRPWRVIDWYYDLDSDHVCVCASFPNLSQ
jgi:hypothetical protein